MTNGQFITSTQNPEHRSKGYHDGSISNQSSSLPSAPKNAHRCGNTSRLHVSYQSRVLSAILFSMYSQRFPAGLSLRCHDVWHAQTRISNDVSPLAKAVLDGLHMYCFISTVDMLFALYSIYKKIIPEHLYSKAWIFYCLCSLLTLTIM